MTVHKLAQRLGEKMSQAGKTVVTAESCTGGLISSAITAVPGSSGWFNQGYVTYSNKAKRQMLGVSQDLIEQHGVVSEAVVRSMLLGALRHSQSDLGVAISGIAGPGGGSAEKPVGTVCIACGSEKKGFAETYRFAGDRSEVRAFATEQALQLLLDASSQFEDS